MNQRLEQSPLAVYQQHLADGQLAYQWDRESGRAVFYPRVAGPGTGNPDLEWRISGGLGTVYATTVVHPREGDPYNVCLVDLDEGFRMMSRVRGTEPHAVRIGMRVKVGVHEPGGDQPVYPVFDVLQGA